MSLRQLMTAQQAAEFLNRTPNWLAKQRCFGSGPAFVKLGRRVLYDIRDLEAFIQDNKRLSTSESNDRKAAP